jgi:hypothetical protein
MTPNFMKDEWNKRLMKRVFYAIFSILHLLSSFLIKSKNFKILGNFMMVGKKQMKHLSTCWRVLANTDADEDLAIPTIAIIELLSAVPILFFGIVTALL